MHTLHFSDPQCRDVRQVGGKAASLAQMTGDGLPVAPGFAVTAAAYRRYLEEDGLQEFVTGVLNEISGHDQQAFDAMEQRLAARLAATPVPTDVTDQVRSAYAALCEETGVENIAVAVRSSATAEDSVDASFAGEFETWVDITGAEEVLAYIHKCYMSVFAGRVLAYLDDKGIDPHLIEMAVVVQKTVRARSAGVMFTLTPTSGDRSKMVIESSWGLGLSVVGGEVTPDRFLIGKIPLGIEERILGHKHIQYRRGDAPVPVPEDLQGELSLQDEEILALARLGLKLEQIHGAAQDIEFAIDEELPEGNNLILLQCRPETVWSHVERQPAFDAGAGMMSWITGSISGNASGLPGATGHQH